jgi:hypothetical protein
MKSSLVCLTIGFVLLLAASVRSDDRKPAEKAQPGPKGSETPARKAALPSPPAITPENETEAIGFVREHHPELAKVLEVLKPMNPVEYRKAIAELWQVSRSLNDLKTRNPKRFEVALDVWKAKSRVELLAAQLAGAPSEELRSQLRTAIETKVDAEIHRQRFDLEQAEAAAKKARETLGRLETNREAIIEARYRALAPKKPARPKKTTESQPAVTPTSTPTSNPPAHPTGEDRK